MRTTMRLLATTALLLLAGCDSITGPQTLIERHAFAVDSAQGVTPPSHAGPKKPFEN